MRAHIAIGRNRLMNPNPSHEPELQRALRPVPRFERAVREISRMLSEAEIRHALAGALAANAYRHRPRTTEALADLATA